MIGREELQDQDPGSKPRLCVYRGDTRTASPINPEGREPLKVNATNAIPSMAGHSKPAVAIQ